MVSDVVSEQRHVSGFDQVALHGAGELIIRPGDQEALAVEAERMVLSEIITEVKDGTLIIRQRPSCWLSSWGRRPLIRFDLTFVRLEGIVVTGAGKLQATGLWADLFDLRISGAAEAALEISTQEFHARLSGAARVRLSGDSQLQRVAVSGAARYLAQELTCRLCKVSIRGAGKVTVNATEDLEVTISGSGNVQYYGSPAVQQRISGAGKVVRLLE